MSSLTVKSRQNHIDLPTLIAVLVLMVLSLGIVYSASAGWAMQKFGESNRLLNSHALKILVGIVALFAGVTIDYRKYRKLTKPVLLGAIGLLLVTLLLGGELKGATRWIQFAGFGFQPSEFAKFALLFHLCSLIAAKGEAIKDFKRGFLPMIIWIGLVSLLVLLQPNFSTGTMIVVVSLIILFVGRARLHHLFLAVMYMVPLLIAYVISAPYRLARIQSFLGTQWGSGRVNYQLWQGIIGFGNGGLLGLGPGESKQRDLFLPESYGDFVFSIVGEEYGFLGTMFFMTLFFLIMIRGFKIAKHAHEEFGRLLALGITCTVTVYALVNASVALGILPTTGLPMPFVSYGGSSLVFSSFAVGALLNISAQTDLHPRSTRLPDGVLPVEPLQEQSPKVY